MTKKQMVALLSDGKGNWTDNSVDECVDAILAQFNVYAINDNVIKQEMVSDLMENYNYKLLDAEAWVRNEGECVISDMWEAYSSYIENNAEYFGGEQ